MGIEWTSSLALSHGAGECEIAGEWASQESAGLWLWAEKDRAGRGEAVGSLGVLRSIWLSGGQSSAAPRILD